MDNIKDDGMCKTCLFYGLCVASKIEHCEYECYVPEIENKGDASDVN